MFGTAEFWVFASFVLFVGLVFYLKAPGRITGALDNRAERIKHELDEARRLREEAQSLLAEYQRKRRDAEKEAEEIVSNAKAEAERMKAEARQQMEDMVNRRERMAELKISQAEEQAVADVRAAAAEAAVSAAARILDTKVTGDTANSLIERSIGQVKERLQ